MALCALLSQPPNALLRCVCFTGLSALRFTNRVLSISLSPIAPQSINFFICFCLRVEAFDFCIVVFFFVNLDGFTQKESLLFEELVLFDNGSCVYWQGMSLQL